jgi:SAM-dependent methyltransferase
MPWIIEQLRSNVARGHWSAAYFALVSYVFERYYEWRYHIESSGYIAPGDLGMRDEEFHGYEGTDYRSLNGLMRRLSITKDDVFLDLGAGKGRALIVAATRPFKRVIGVEISPELATIALRNVERARPRLRCQDIRVVTADVTAYRVPDDTSVAFVFNAFHGNVLLRVLANLKASFDQAPRRLRVVFVNPHHIDALAERALEGWLVRGHTISFWGAQFGSVIYETAASAVRIAERALTTARPARPDERVLNSHITVAFRDSSASR